MTAEFQEYNRLAYLGDKVNSGTSTEEEKNEFMKYLYTHGKITSEQYENYKAGRNADKIVNMALSVGAVFLMTYLFSQTFSKKSA
jgi:hypothetical protein